MESRRVHRRNGSGKAPRQTAARGGARAAGFKPRPTSDSDASMCGHRSGWEMREDVFSSNDDNENDEHAESLGRRAATGPNKRVRRSASSETDSDYEAGASSSSDKTAYVALPKGRRASRSKRNRDADDDGSVTTQCPHCEKSYRQNNSFYKHLYEHHPHWNQISKDYNLSKHQQVMLMQTAEVLLSFKFPERYGLQPLVRF